MLSKSCKLPARLQIGYQCPQVYLHGSRYHILTGHKFPLILLTTFWSLPSITVTISDSHVLWLSVIPLLNPDPKSQ